MPKTPQAFKYQLIARDISGAILSNQTIGLQISIVQDNPAGTIVYTEQHTPATNSNGLVNIEIGTGSVITGTFGTINWGSTLHYLKLELDPAGMTTYVTMGTTQLVSVPYALHAKTAESLTSGAAGWGLTGNAATDSTVN